ncbi:MULTISPECIES: hypothetical protein [unclassified Spirillospora]|uniref:hypothetical protein n=1 Tax=unclassified Spirillospora TaxID=2642701 RepID=UPI00371B6E38
MALVVRPDAEVEDDLLDLLAEETGHRFTYHGSGGFGVELLATAYKDESGNLLIEAEALDAPVKAVVMHIGSVDEAVKIRQVVGDHLGGWSEQMLRAQLESNGLESNPGVLLALAMAGGGGSLDSETVDLINGAAEHEDEAIADWASYAIRVWNELREPPILMAEKEQEIPAVLRPAEEVDGEEGWVTARPGVPGRAIPRATTWLRVSGDGDALFHSVMQRFKWFFAVAGDTRSDWYEQITTSRDESTAIHLVRHPALPADHLVVHGDSTSDVIAEIRRKNDVHVLDGPPASLEQTSA